MINFTTSIKKEIIAAGFENACCKRAALSAFLRTSGSLKTYGSFVGFEMVSENEDVVDFFYALLENLFGENVEVVNVGKDKLSGNCKMTIQCLSERSANTLIELGIINIDNGGITVSMNIDKYLLENDCCKRSYIIGAFLGSGSCTIPNEETETGYHLEFVFANKNIADKFCELLCFYEILPKLIARKDKWVVYIKSSDGICDFLSVIGADRSLDRLSEVIAKRDTNNYLNRAANCTQSNYDKSVQTAIKQLKAIELIEDVIGIYELDEPLVALANARLENVSASMSELAATLGVSKSCLNHRMRKLMEIAAALSEE